MARQPRQLEGNVVYHLYNRRNEKQSLFECAEEYADFCHLLRDARVRHAIRLHAYCLMQTHWHLAMSAEDPRQISRCVGWLCTKHAMRFRSDTKTLGLGHVYQGRFGSVAVDGVVHYVRLIRYIESNPLTAGCVGRAEDWEWSSLRERGASDPWLDVGPWQLPSDWIALVNTPALQVELLPELLNQVALFRPCPISFH
jgi:putative transposase